MKNYIKYAELIQKINFPNQWEDIEYRAKDLNSKMNDAIDFLTLVHPSNFWQMEDKFELEDLITEIAFRVGKEIKTTIPSDVFGLETVPYINEVLKVENKLLVYRIEDVENYKFFIIEYSNINFIKEQFEIFQLKFVFDEFHNENNCVCNYNHTHSDFFETKIETEKFAYQYVVYDEFETLNDFIVNIFPNKYSYYLYKDIEISQFKNLKNELVLLKDKKIHYSKKLLEVVDLLSKYKILTFQTHYCDEGEDGFVFYHLCKAADEQVFINYFKERAIKNPGEFKKNIYTKLNNI